MSKSYQQTARMLLKGSLNRAAESVSLHKIPFICIAHVEYGEVRKETQYSSKTILSEGASRLRYYMKSAGYIELDEHYDKVTALGINFAESTIFMRYQFWFGIVLGSVLSVLSGLLLFLFQRSFG